MAQKIFYSFLMAVGALIMTLTGLCTLVYEFSEVSRYYKKGGTIFEPITLVAGVLPFVIGLLIFLLGRYLKRKYAQQESKL